MKTKKIEKIRIYGETSSGQRTTLVLKMEILVDKINEIIDYLNKLEG